jgi:hypothetical protein
MSPPKVDRNIQSLSGRTFLPELSETRSNLRFVRAIADALRTEYGESHAAVKTVVTLTGANERAVKNWFGAKNGPSAEFFVALCRHSDRVLETFLRMAGREEQLQAKTLADARATLRQMLALLDELQTK